MPQRYPIAHMGDVRTVVVLTGGVLAAAVRGTWSASIVLVSSSNDISSLAQLTSHADQNFKIPASQNVGGRTAVLEVALLVLPDQARNANAGAPIGHAGREGVDARGFVVTGEASGIVEPPFGVVGPDVIHVSLRQPVDGLLNDSAKERGISKAVTKKEEFTTLKTTETRPYFSPPSSRISLVLKLVWQPAPFQFPEIGLGSKETTTPKSSHTL
ncbi:hypothetical protein EYF80_040013 [Liparis tanakae]|uniref:Uncharacterized protein n=1 Tax=Liparis tanakae TaxID=230148 RepID=A0A4Z2G8E9_9TELE|nr:hypothetical protein EYF80_040013 [Liparis tanakae]